MDYTPMVEEEDSAGSDGDDLMVPSAILVSAANIKETPGVKTPQRSIRPEDYVSPLVDKEGPREHAKGNASKKYCLSKLLQEKKAVEQSKGSYQDIGSALKEDRRQGLGLLQFSESQDLDISQDLEESFGADLMPELKPRMKTLISSVKNDFPDGFPGEKWICHKESTKLSKPPSEVTELPLFNGLHPVDYNMLIEVLASRGNLPLFMDILSPGLLDWFLSASLLCQDVTLSLRIMETALEVINQEAKHGKEPNWLPSHTKFMVFLRDFGLAMPFEDPKLEDLLNAFQEPNEISESAGATTQAKKLKLQNFLTIYSMALRYFPRNYSVVAVRIFIVTSLIFLLDVKLVALTWTFQEMIGHALDAIDASLWEEEVLLLCSISSTVASHHRNYVHLVDCLPATKRGLQLQHTMSLFLISHLLQKENFVSLDELKNSIKTQQMEVILRICNCLGVSDATDYYQLNSILWLINLALPVSGFAVKQKKLLQAMIMKFRKLNGSIRDPRGAFMNRTKVKDLIVRIITRLNYVYQGLESQCHLEDFFQSYSDDTDFSESLKVDLPQEGLDEIPFSEDKEVSTKLDFDTEPEMMTPVSCGPT